MVIVGRSDEITGYFDMITIVKCHSFLDFSSLHHAPSHLQLIQFAIFACKIINKVFGIQLFSQLVFQHGIQRLVAPPMRMHLLHQPSLDLGKITFLDIATESWQILFTIVSQLSGSGRSKQVSRKVSNRQSTPVHILEGKMVKVRLYYISIFHVTKKGKLKQKWLTCRQPLASSVISTSSMDFINSFHFCGISSTSIFPSTTSRSML